MSNCNNTSKLGALTLLFISAVLVLASVIKGGAMNFPILSLYLPLVICIYFFNCNFVESMKECGPIIRRSLFLIIESFVFMSLLLSVAGSECPKKWVVFTAGALSALTLLCIIRSAIRLACHIKNKVCPVCGD